MSHFVNETIIAATTLKLGWDPTLRSECGGTRRARRNFQQKIICEELLCSEWEQVSFGVGPKAQDF